MGRADREVLASGRGPVLGGSSSAQLRDREPRWLRKAGITWMLRGGRSLTEVADTVGNSPVVVLEHYAGLVDGSPGRQVWTGWDDAWAWGITETDVP